MATVRNAQSRNSCDDTASVSTEVPGAYSA